MSSASPPARRPSPLALCALAGLVLVTLRSWWDVLGLTLLGWDTYPLIATAAKAQGAGILGFFEVLTRELMDGRYPLGHYWRPITQLSFAIDHSLHGVRASGYHATDLAILCTSAVLVVQVVRRGTRSRQGDPRVLLAGLLGGLCWSLHPAHFDILTVPARRADALAALFTLAALWVQLGPRTRARAVRVGLCCAAALASKETGAVATPLLLLLAWLQNGAATGASEAQEPTPRGARLGRTLRDAGPVLLIVGVALAARTWTLGGAGGSEEATLLPDPARVAELLPTYLGWVWFPPALFGGSVGAPALLLTLGLAILVVLGLRSRLEPGPAPGELSIAAGGLFFLLWFVGLTLVTATSGIVQQWYALPYLAAVSVATGWLARQALMGLGSQAPLRRSAGGLGLLLVLIALVSNARGAGPGEAAEDYARISEETERFLDSFRDQIEHTRPGGDLRVRAAFEWARVDEEGALVRKVFPLGPYSLEAYAELILPERNVFVLEAGDPNPRAAEPDEVRVFAQQVPQVVGPEAAGTPGSGRSKAR